MFCHVCGAEAIEGALFCQKCGAKLITEDESAQQPIGVQQQTVYMDESVGASSPRSTDTLALPTEQEPETVQGTNTPWAGIPPIDQRPKPANTPELGKSTSTPGDPSGIYTALKDNIKMCPAITSAKQVNYGVFLRSGAYKHFVTVQANRAKIESNLIIPLLFLLALSTALLIGAISQFGLAIVSIDYWEEYGPLFSTCCILTSLGDILYIFFLNKKKTAVAAYVQGIVESQGFVLAEKKPGKLFNVVIVIAAVFFMLVGVASLIHPITELFNSDIGEDMPTVVSSNPEPANSVATGATSPNQDALSIQYPLTSSTDAQKVFDEWAADHPVHFDYDLRLNSDNWTDDNGNSCFVFDAISDGIAVFSISVRKSDGYMLFIYERGGSQDLDEWYEESYGTGNTNRRIGAIG